MIFFIHNWVSLGGTHTKEPKKIATGITSFFLKEKKMQIKLAENG